MSLSGNDALKLSGAMMVTFYSLYLSLSLANERITKFVKNKRAFFSLSHCVQHSLTNILFIKFI